MVGGGNQGKDIIIMILKTTEAAPVKEKTRIDKLQEEILNLKKITYLLLEESKTIPVSINQKDKYQIIKVLNPLDQTKQYASFITPRSAKEAEAETDKLMEEAAEVASNK